MLSSVGQGPRQHDGVIVVGCLDVPEASAAPPGGVTFCQVRPPSVVRTTLPSFGWPLSPPPTAQTTEWSTTSAITSRFVVAVGVNRQDGPGNAPARDHAGALLAAAGMDVHTHVVPVARTVTARMVAGLRIGAPDVGGRESAWQLRPDDRYADVFPAASRLPKPDSTDPTRRW
jgi:hypothetical protein